VIEIDGNGPTTGTLFAVAASEQTALRESERDLLPCQLPWDSV
jgi:hypothetical protein